MGFLLVFVVVVCFFKDKNAAKITSKFRGFVRVKFILPKPPIMGIISCS